jgi:hypothetical protein
MAATCIVAKTRQNKSHNAAVQPALYCLVLQNAGDRTRNGVEPFAFGTRSGSQRRVRRAGITSERGL